MTKNVDTAALIVGRTAATYFFADSEIYARECGDKILAALAAAGYRLSRDYWDGDP